MISGARQVNLARDVISPRLNDSGEKCNKNSEERSPQNEQCLDKLHQSSTARYVPNDKLRGIDSAEMDNTSKKRLEKNSHHHLQSISKSSTSQGKCIPKAPPSCNGCLENENKKIHNKFDIDRKRSISDTKSERKAKIVKTKAVKTADSFRKEVRNVKIDSSTIENSSGTITTLHGRRTIQHALSSQSDKLKLGAVAQEQSHLYNYDIVCSSTNHSAPTIPNRRPDFCSENNSFGDDTGSSSLVRFFVQKPVAAMKAFGNEVWETFSPLSL